MKKLISICLLLSCLFITAACTSQETNEDISNGEKVLLMANSLPGEITLSTDETYEISLPYAAEVSYASDCENVAKVAENGLISPVGDGSCIISIYDNGLIFYTVVHVIDTGHTLQTEDPYAAYTADNFDAETIKSDLETYASAAYGFTIKQELTENNAKLMAENPFTIEYNHSGCNVKYKLLTTIASLKLDGYTNLAISAEKNETQVVCKFFAE